MASAQKGFFTDTTLCIGCKACEVACKQWNQLPDDGFHFTGMSYDNTGHLGSSTWRHVSFVERPGTGCPSIERPAMPEAPGARAGNFSWLMMSDVCKHCERAGCLEACPTGAIVRTEFDTVYIQPDVCNGCGYCISACPFGVVDRREDDGRAWKCTLCYDRLGDGMQPACAKACPTSSIQFGDLVQLKVQAEARVEELHGKGLKEAYLYGDSAASQPGTGGLHAFFLLVDKPEVYNLPPDPEVPTLKGKRSWKSAGLAMLGLAALALGTVLLDAEVGR
ncbi:4Fe-4S dicluster domain-containing protein [Aggregicoccus sp. 17bor-14]|uniref:4Fe-4S dicluster domain-containing protein n=1 Tax=Myxococcaceae TaxID=31 RepID=UPI00129C7425|nr:MULTISPECIES: 4Fe-4S dicluster domain-containing protein [Myxococcaceae]MBF5046522.1 4Fe-4S dicluster domain-containing protein [Simulacricoccus sp. 17bor-14]MRI92237.1 4Fe-4S dicluster domain-containing protein [Aggregicoccus sp. 17bor-14]